MMKYLIIGLLSSLVLLASCGKEIVDPVIKQKFIIDNSTGQSIHLDVYHETFVSSYDIGSEKKLIQEVDAFAGTSGLVQGADSVFVTWKDGKKLAHKNTDVRAINIIHLNNYTATEDEDVKIYSYIFTNIDYEAAQ